MEKILVPTDFSGNSKAGMRFAIQLSRATGAELIFYHVVELLKPTSWNDFRYMSFVKSKTKLYTGRLESFVKYVSKSGQLPGVSVNYVVEVGDPASQMIMAYARKNRVSLISLSTRGAGRLKKVLGTHSSALVNDSPVPVVVVPRRHRVHNVGKIMYASDFASLGHELKRLRKFLHPMKTHINVCHFDYLMHVEGNVQKIEKKAAGYKSDDVSFTFRKRSIEHTLAEDLRKVVVRQNPDMLVLFTKHNRTWFDRLFALSEARDMSFRPIVPLLVMRKNDKS